MKLLMLSAYVFAAISVVGCSQRPLTYLEAQEPQRTVIAAQHWRALSDRVVASLVCNVDISDGAKVGTCNTNPPVYITSTAPDMPFSDAFRVYLTNSLIERGIQISKTPANADIVKYHVQPFLYDNRTRERHLFDTSTFWTTLAALGWAGAEIGVSTGAGIVALAAAGPALDFLNGMRNVTNAEVVMTAILERQGTIADLYVEEFYVQRRDVVPGGLYWTNFPADPLDEQPLQLGPPPRARTIRVSNE